MNGILEDGPIRKLLTEKTILRNPEDILEKTKQVSITVAPLTWWVERRIRGALEELGWSYAGKVEYLGVTDLIFYKGL